jgi:hypothetical protein
MKSNRWLKGEVSDSPFNWEDLHGKEFTVSVGEDNNEEGCYQTAVLVCKKTSEAYVIHSGWKK